MDDAGGCVGVLIVGAIIAAIIAAIVIYVGVPAIIFAAISGVIFGFVCAIRNYFTAISTVFSKYGKRGLIISSLMNMALVLILAGGTIAIVMLGDISNTVETFMATNQDSSSMSTAPTANPVRFSSDSVLVADMRQIYPAQSEATSTLATDEIDYTVTNAIDNDAETCWAEGIDGSGIGESLRFSFDTVFNLSALSISNGIQYQNGEYFPLNNRISVLLVSLSKDGDVFETIELYLNDEKRIQYILLNDSVPVDELIFEIQDTYSGSQFDDTCLNEVEFFAHD